MINITAYIEYGTHTSVQDFIWHALCDSTEVSQQLQVMPSYTSHTDSTLAYFHALPYIMSCSWGKVADGIHFWFFACVTAAYQ